MGRGISQLIASKGMDVILIERHEEGAKLGYKKLEESMDAEIDRWTMTEAEKKAIRHAERFVEDRARHISALAETMAGRCPVVSSLYDAELFGHWWFEGPAFIEALLRYAARQNTFSCILPSGYLKANPVHQLCSPASSSWGNGGYSEMWLDESNDWIYRHLHRACVSMISLAGEFSDAAGLLRRYLDQAARELMLAQASDWAFIMKTKTSVGYAVKRTIEHLKNFRELEKRISAKALDEKFVTQLENLDNLFSDMDYRCFRSDYVAPW